MFSPKIGDYSQSVVHRRFTTLSTMTVHSQCYSILQILHLREKSQEFVIDNVKEDFVVSLLRGFSAPIRLIHDVNDNDLAFLVANDTDPFNRYEAGQRLLKRIILHTASQVLYLISIRRSNPLLLVKYLNVVA